MSQDNDNQKTAYICGPLTELSESERLSVKLFYEHIADVYEEITGMRAFVPHEHYDPILHANFSPKEVDLAERSQIQNRTSLLVVVAIAPSFGGGIEVEIANNNNVPVIIIHPAAKKISRLLLGNPAVKEVISYIGEEEAIKDLRVRFEKITVERCICPKECDCQRPDPLEGLALLSNHCPIHNYDPIPYPECPADYHSNE